MSEWNWTPVNLKSIKKDGEPLIEEVVQRGSIKINIMESQRSMSNGVAGYLVIVNNRPLRDSWYERVEEIGFIDEVPFAIVMEPDQYERRIIIDGNGNIAIDYFDDTTRQIPEIEKFIRNQDTLRTFMFSRGAIVQILENGQPVTYYGRPV